MRGRIALQKHYPAKFREGGWKCFRAKLGSARPSALFPSTQSTDPDQLALPWNKQCRCPGGICCDRFERATRCNEGLLQS
jgi:hypothetical protein